VDLLEQDGNTSDDEELAEHRMGLIKSHEGWQKEMAKWIEEERAQSDEDDNEVGDGCHIWSSVLKMVAAIT
jgi:hypothetical protein